MHLKKIVIPKSWPLPRKDRVFIVRGRGPHPMKTSLPLLVILRDILKEIKTRREAKKILNEGKVLIDNRVIKDEKFSVGLFDRIYLKKLEKGFTVNIGKKGKLKIEELSKEQLSNKICKVIGKRILKKNKIQINLHDGRNVVVGDKNIKIGDSVVIDLNTNRIIKHLKLREGAKAIVIGGKHVGQEGTISGVDDLISIVIEKNTFRIPKEKVFVIEV